jgi:mono/diheme cytochrome c family protein
MRLIKIFTVFAFVSIFVLASCGKKAPKPLSVQESVRVEASFFRANCVVCHGKEAEGGELSGGEVPSLREGEAVKRSDAELYDQIANGKNGMPPYKHQLTDEQIRNMVRFVRDLQKPDY